MFNANLKADMKRDLLLIVEVTAELPQRACATIGLNIQTYYLWRREDPTWRARLDEALIAVADNYEDLLYTEAKKGNVEAIKQGLKLYGRTASDAAQINILNVDKNLLTDVQLRQIASNALPQLESPDDSGGGGGTEGS